MRRWSDVRFRVQSGHPQEGVQCPLMTQSGTVLRHAELYASRPQLCLKPRSFGRSPVPPTANTSVPKCTSTGRSASMTDCGSRHADTAHSCPTGTATEGHLCDHAIRLWNWRPCHCFHRRSNSGPKAATAINLITLVLSFCEAFFLNSVFAHSVSSCSQRQTQGCRPPVVAVTPLLRAPWSAEVAPTLAPSGGFSILLIEQRASYASYRVAM